MTPIIIVLHINHNLLINLSLCVYMLFTAFDLNIYMNCIYRPGAKEFKSANKDSVLFCIEWMNGKMVANTALI